MSLPLRLRVKDCEPGHGVLLRLSARNGRHLVSSFASSLGVQMREALAGRDVQRLTGFAGLPALQCSWWSPVISTSDRIACVAGEELSLGDWSVTSRRHCPECLREDADAAASLGIPDDWFVSHRSWWDVRSIAGCPTHGVALVDTCWRCDTKLQFGDSRRLVCKRCGADLRAQAAVLDDPLGRYVAARLGVGSSHRPRILEDLPLRHAIRLCGKLGRAALGGVPDASPAGVPSPGCGAVGFGRAMLGVRALDDVLDRAVSDRGIEAPEGLMGTYGWLHTEWLGIEDPTAASFRDVLRRHAIAHGVIAKDEERLGADPPPTISLTSAAAQAGIAVERMRRELEEAGAIPSGSRRGVAFALDPSVVRTVGRRRGAVRRAALEVLGVGRTALESLASAGMVDMAGEETFRASAEALLQRVGPNLCAGSAHHGATPLPEACVAVSVSMARVVRALEEGVIPAWAGDVGVGLAGILVRSADLRPFRARPDGVTAIQASATLGLHQQCVRALVRCGVLKRGPKGFISPADLATFQREYASGSQLAAEWGCSPASLVARLAGEGIFPAWPLSTHRQAVFRWADLKSMSSSLH